MVDSLQEYVCFAGSLSVGLFVMIRTKHRRQESIMVRVWAGQPWDLLLLFLCYCEVSAVCYPPISSQVVLMDPDGLPALELSMNFHEGLVSTGHRFLKPAISYDLCIPINIYIYTNLLCLNACRAYYLHKI